MKITTIFIIIILLSKITLASTVAGQITDEDDNKLPYSTVYVKNTTYGVAADFNGNYFLELSPGTHTLVYSYMGYQTVEEEVTIKKNENIVLNVTLLKSDIIINEIEIVANRVDKAKSIMRKTRDNRRMYLTSVNNFQCLSYVKTSIEHEVTNDTINEAKDFETYLEKESMNLIEYIAITFFKRQNKFKEKILAYHNYTKKKPVGMQVSATMEYGENDIAPQQFHSEDPYVFYKNSTSGNFNFYKNLLEFPILCKQPLVSPIAGNSSLYYKYEFSNSFYQDNKKINKIIVTPLNKSSALFYGYIYVEDSTWALLSVNLSINEKALTLYKNFNIIQNYEKISDSIYLPVRTEIIYTIKDIEGNILGNTKIINKDYVVNKEIDRKTFNNELISYEIDAFDKDSLFWENNRPVTLKKKELNFIDKSDSIQQYYTSDKYLDKQDSLFNKLHWWSPFVGVGYRNHYIGIQLWVGGLMQQVVPFGVGGYRHKLPIQLSKEFNNSMVLETRFEIDYGFRNRDFKGKFGVGLTYYPKKFIRTYVEIGDFYDQINNYASFEQTFSRSNYVRSKTFEIKQRMEIFNGLYAELSYMYSNQFPITDLQLSPLLDSLFGEINEPIEFEQYTKSEVRLELKYRVGQKYIIKKNKKIIIGKEYPEILFIYRKGIPGLFNSEVNFDYLELGAKDILNLARFGEMRWQVRVGIFANKTDLRQLEYKYFRGSDSWFFSDPVNSMQLIPLMLNTNYQFLQANIIHHFNGSILNKVPLIKFLKLSIATGAGTLNIPQQDFYHIEGFVGLERVVRIKQQLFRFGLYAVTADNTISTANIRLKFGISYFNSYTNKWNY